MPKTRRSIEKIIEEQVRRWHLMRRQERKTQAPEPVITISREPGSGGKIVAKNIAERLKFDFFHQEIILEMAESAKVDNRILETLDEKGLNVLEHWISSLINQRHLWPDEHLLYLMKVVGAIGKHGRAVIVGRGANFILPPAERFSVRIVAPLGERAKNVSRDFGISTEKAKTRILRTESDREAFIRKFFYADIADPKNYEVVINTGTVSIDKAVDMICTAYGK